VNAPRLKPPAPASDPITTALRSVLGDLVREAVAEAYAEIRDAEPLRPVLLSSDQLGQAIGCSRATISRLVHEGCGTRNTESRLRPLGCVASACPNE
jgi:hypothetical protein